MVVRHEDLTRVVLNAFRHLRKVHMSSFYALLGQSCAQRLSASEEGSRIVPATCLVVVLVLNAFRHLRKVHRSRDASQSLTMLCSTPFGI